MRLLCFLSLCLWTEVAMGQQLEVNAPGRVDMGEPYFQVRYTIKTTHTHDFVPPQTNDFEQLSAPGISTMNSTVIVNGDVKTESSTTFTLTYAPLKKGTFTLPAATVDVNGKTVKSATVKIQVTGEGRPSAGNSLSASRRQEEDDLRNARVPVTDKDLFIQTTAERTQAYEQEAVLLTYRFYARSGVGLSNLAISEKPNFQGMMSQEIQPKSIDAEITHLNGETYRTGIIMQYLVYPQKAGKVKVPGITFDCYVIQSAAMDDMLDAYFNGMSQVGRTLKRTSNALEFDVKALPEPKPADFSGGVGIFQIKGELLTPHPKANEVCTYRLTVEGKGNLKMLAPPVLNLPTDFDSYNPKTVEHTEVTPEGVKGKMVYEYTFVPRNMGGYHLEGMSFSYFDTDKKAYVTLTTDSIGLHVEKGTKSDEEYEREKQYRNADIRDVRPTGELSASGSLLSAYAPWSYLVCYVLWAGLFCLAAHLLGKYIAAGADTADNRRNKASRMAKKRLRVAGKLLKSNDDKAFYAEISRALYAFLADRYTMGLSVLNRDMIANQLLAHVDEELRNAFLGLMDECELAQFAPQGGTARKEDVYDQALMLIDSMPKQPQ